MEFNFKCNAFELYGADFLLSYDLKPWLIEINSSPALGATTAVTTRMCAAMLEDIVRLVKKMQSIPLKNSFCIFHYQRTQERTRLLLI